MTTTVTSLGAFPSSNGGGGDAPPYVLPPATNSKLGGVIPGANLTITPEGVLNAPAPSSGGSTGKPKILQNIATRCRPNGGINATFPFAWSRTMHINRGDSVESVQLVFAHWGASYQGETTVAADLSIACSIEYPMGVYYQGLWNGTALGIINPGKNGTSDPISVAIPKGATFWVRTWQNCASGTWGSSAAALQRNAPAIGSPSMQCIETARYGTTAADTYDATVIAGSGALAINGFGPAGTNANGFFPLAVLGMSSVESVLVVGDSRNSGKQDSASANMGYLGIGEICRSLDYTNPYCNAGFDTDQAATFVANSTYRKTMGAFHSAVHSEYAINDLTFGRTVAQLQASQQAIFAMFPGKLYSLSTCTPKTTSTNGWIDQDGQTVTNGGNESQRPVYNTWVRSKPLGVTAIFDVAAVVESPVNVGKWKTPDGDTYTNRANVVVPVTAPLTGDGTHEAPYGYGVIQKSPAIDGRLLVAA
ncbi:hypothetical protein M0D69_13955 [Caballeronia sp. SEWSISQ10-4 2]|uniref:hypothetical protein n=1 Tax=Caballeronia sp. SEWSISQ10-4 2 TaxID=2937438 RepID=UPI0026547F62|nr:hypothetical protein [Caballeronia sp. SEWSISQ10-4 2]MDN7179098.1 hypothetical protein [Caballeronia sp. SEWSISQ10-4 2]